MTTDPTPRVDASASGVSVSLARCAGSPRGIDAGWSVVVLSALGARTLHARGASVQVRGVPLDSVTGAGRPLDRGCRWSMRAGGPR